MGIVAVFMTTLVASFTAVAHFAGGQEKGSASRIVSAVVEAPAVPDTSPLLSDNEELLEAKRVPDRDSRTVTPIPPVSPDEKKPNAVLAAQEVKITTTPRPTETPLPTSISPYVVEVTASPLPTATPTPSPLLTATPQPPTLAPYTASATQIDGWFEQFGREYNVEVALLRKIAVCESGYNTNARSKHGYGGMFQFSAVSWQSTRTHMGLDTNPDLRFNAEEAIRTAAFKISRSGTGSWPSCSK